MIHRTQLSVQSKLLSNLGIEDKAELWEDFRVVIPSISAYLPYYNDVDEIEDNKTSLYIHGECFIINTPFKNFDKIMKELLLQV